MNPHGPSQAAPSIGILTGSVPGLDTRNLRVNLRLARNVRPSDVNAIPREQIVHIPHLPTVQAGHALVHHDHHRRRILVVFLEHMPGNLRHPSGHPTHAPPFVHHLRLVLPPARLRVQISQCLVYGKLGMKKSSTRRLDSGASGLHKGEDV